MQASGDSNVERASQGKEYGLHVVKEGLFPF